MVKIVDCNDFIHQTNGFVVVDSNGKQLRRSDNLKRKDNPPIKPSRKKTRPTLSDLDELEDAIFNHNGSKFNPRVIYLTMRSEKCSKAENTIGPGRYVTLRHLWTKQYWRPTFDKKHVKVISPLNPYA